MPFLVSAPGYFAAAMCEGGCFCTWEGDFGECHVQIEVLAHMEGLTVLLQMLRRIVTFARYYKGIVTLLQKLI